MRSLVRSATLALSASALAMACAPRGPAETSPRAPPARVRLAQASAGTGVSWVAGSIVAAQRASVSTRVAARVRSVNVEEGAAVAAGALLLRLDDEDLRSQLRAAETALAAARAHERRVEALVAGGTLPEAELDAARPRRAQAEAQVAAVRASLAYTEVRSPFSGLVQAKRVQPGDFVSPGQPLIDLEGGGLEISATLSEEEARGISGGDRLPFEAQGLAGTAEVVALTPGGDALSHRRFLRARILQPRGWRSGSFARLALPSGGAGGVWIPRSALVERGDLTGVFVADGGRAELRWLALGDASETAVAVRAGLHRDDRVIDAPGDLRDGQPVEVSGGP